MDVPACKYKISLMDSLLRDTRKKQPENAILHDVLYLWDNGTNKPITNKNKYK